MTALRMTGENHRLCGPANGDGTPGESTRWIFDKQIAKFYRGPFGWTGLLPLPVRHIFGSWRKCCNVKGCLKSPANSKFSGIGQPGWINDAHQTWTLSNWLS